MYFAYSMSSAPPSSISAIWPHDSMSFGRICGSVVTHCSHFWENASAAPLSSAERTSAAVWLRSPMSSPISVAASRHASAQRRIAVSSPSGQSAPMIQPSHWTGSGISRPTDQFTSALEASSAAL